MVEDADVSWVSAKKTNTVSIFDVKVSVKKMDRARTREIGCYCSHVFTACAGKKR